MEQKKTAIRKGVAIQLAAGLGGVVIAIANIAVNLSRDMRLEVNGYLGFIVLFMVEALLLLIGLQGVYKLGLEKELRKIRPLLTKDGSKVEAISLEELAQALSMPMEKAASFLSAMIQWKLLTGYHLDASKQLLRAGEETPRAEQDLSKDQVLVERRVKSIVPAYYMAAVWLLYAFSFPLYRGWDLLAVLLISLLAFTIGLRLFPEVTAYTAMTRAKVMETGNRDLDAITEGGLQFLGEMKKSTLTISDQAMKGSLQSVSQKAEELLRFIKDNPDRARELYTFTDYYFPTTAKLAGEYAKMESYEEKGETVSQAMGKIQEALGVVEKAFDRELHGLRQDQAMDISADIAVLNSMIESNEDLRGEDASNTADEA